MSEILAEDIVKYINKNYVIINGVSGIASHFYISKEYLCRLFRQYSGVTVVTYINVKKIKLAQKMLLKTDKSVTQISEECGFSSSSYFTKKFKQINNMSPTEYRVRERIH